MPYPEGPTQNELVNGDNSAIPTPTESGISWRRHLSLLREHLGNFASPLFHTPSLEPAIAGGIMLPPINDGQSQLIEQHANFYQGSAPRRRLPRRLDPDTPKPGDIEPTKLPGYVTVYTQDGPYTVADDAFAQRKRWVQGDVKSRYHARWFDKPIWWLEGFTIGLKNRPPFLDRLYETVETKARLAGEDPGFFLNQQRIKRANRQKINEVTSSEARLFLYKGIKKVGQFLKHQAIHAGKFAIHLIQDVPLAGSALAAVWDIYSGALEEVPMNVLMGVIGAGFYTAEGTLIATVPIAGLIAAAGLFAGNVLLNMYVNGAMSRRYDEANDRMIPYEHRNMLVNRRQLPAYDTAIKNAVPSRKWNGRPFILGGLGVKTKPLLEKLRDTEQELNPYPGFGEPTPAQQKYAERAQELRYVRLIINILNEKKRHELTHDRWWKHFPIFGVLRRIDGELANYQQAFMWIDREMFVDFEDPHIDAALMVQMVEDVNRRRPGFLGS